MKEIISSGLAELGLADRVPEHAPEQLAEYGRLMLAKNQVMNLTAIREEDGVARLHMLDSAALLNWGDFEGKTLLDVGTGAGLPGLPLKILVPSLQVTLLDSLNKRVDWLNEVCAQLGLEGIQAVHARAEEQALLLCCEHGITKAHQLPCGEPLPRQQAGHRPRMSLSVLQSPSQI